MFWVLFVLKIGFTGKSDNMSNCHGPVHPNGVWAAVMCAHGCSPHTTTRADGFGAGTCKTMKRPFSGLMRPSWSHASPPDQHPSSGITCIITWLASNAGAEDHKEPLWTGLGWLFQSWTFIEAGEATNGNISRNVHLHASIVFSSNSNHFFKKKSLTWVSAEHVTSLDHRFDQNTLS